VAVAQHWIAKVLSALSFICGSAGKPTAQIGLIRAERK
jgi:hypothetical protein